MKILSFHPQKNNNTQKSPTHQNHPNFFIQLIEDRKYGSTILHYTGNMILVAVNYDPNSTGKKHTCQIKDFVVK